MHTSATHINLVHTADIKKLFFGEEEEQQEAASTTIYDIQDRESH